MSLKKIGKMDTTCITCQKEGHLYIKKFQHKITYKNKPLYFNTELTACRNCGEKFYTSSQFRSQSQKINMAIRMREKLLMPEKIKKIRLKTKLSQQKLAKKLGLSIKSFAKWESNQDVHSIQMDNLLRAIDRDPSLVDYLGNIRKRAA